jgi:WD40 repeat protein/serine/threonine protein kinase
MSMNDESRCPDCGAKIPRNAPQGLCPTCVLKVAARTELSPATSTMVQAEQDDGQLFGPYTTVKMLGEGGMGIVYVARQEQPIQRIVALKVIKPGMDSRHVIARFEAERQALAMMDHPNIARVFDAGADADGRPYFAMEYISGIPITDYCDVNRLSNRERLELFRQVCLAVHHAHQRGIIHRDLKPSNVLVAMQDGKPVPKIIDFGVAKAIRQRLAERTVFTEQGVLIGTPEYMSPEQAQMTDHDVDTATDIYSLGMLLYELLTGVLPFDSRELRRAGYLEILRRIREDDPPPLRGRLKAMGARAAEVATRHNTDLHSLEKQLGGDLEWITARAIEKDRGRRYPSASELAADIARYLNDDPVMAGPPSRMYRVRKFVRKNRLAVVAAGALLICLTAGVTVSTVLYFREQIQRDIAERQSYRANLANADALIEASEYEGARARLFECAPRLRGWEWRMLYAQSDTSERLLHAPGDPLHGFLPQAFLGFSPEGMRLFYTTLRTTHGWDTASWEPVVHCGPFRAVLGMAPDGSKIAALSPKRGTVDLLVIDSSSGRRVSTLSGHTRVGAAAFSPDGERVATSSYDGTVRICDALNGNVLATIRTGERGTMYPRVLFSPNGRLVASTAGTSLYLFDARNGRSLAVMKGAANAFPFGIAFSPDGKRLAMVSALAFHIFEVPSGKVLRSWSDTVYSTSVAFSPDGAKLASASRNGGVRLWDASAGRLITTLHGATDALAAVTFTPDGKRLVAGCYTGGIWIWSAETYGGTELPGSSSGTIATHYATGRLAAAEWGSRRPFTVDMKTGAVQWLPGTASAVAFSPSGDRLVTGDVEGGMSVIDLRTGSVLTRWIGHANRVWSVAWSPDGQYIASGSDEPAACIWNAATREQVAKIWLPGRVNVVAFSPDGKRLGTGFGQVPAGPIPGGAAAVWEVPSGKLAFRLAPESATSEIAVNSLAFSPSGRLIASGVTGPNNAVRVFESATGRLLASLEGHTADINAVTFSPDEHLIVSAAGNNTLHFWDAVRHELLFTRRRPGEWPYKLSFSGDGVRLLIAHIDGKVRVLQTKTSYPAEIRETVERLRKRYPIASDLRWRLQENYRLNPSMHTMALQLAGRADWDARANDQVWQTLLTKPDDAALMRLGLRRAEEFYRTHAWSVEAWTQVGAARYRNGQHKEAIEILLRASAVGAGNPLIETFLAMAYHMSAQRDAAHESLDRARLSLKSADPVARAYSTQLIREAEALLSGATTH